MADTSHRARLSALLVDKHNEAKFVADELAARIDKADNNAHRALMLMRVLTPRPGDDSRTSVRMTVVSELLRASGYLPAVAGEGAVVL